MPTNFPKDDLFLLTPPAKTIYAAIKELPILDYHCHIDAKELYENKPFPSLTAAWLKADHYKWRAMRFMGVPERLITGTAEDLDKFVAWATVMPKLAGNPLYHFSHMELKQYFGITTPLTPATAEAIYKEAGERLADITPQAFVTRSNVACVVTTNDPLEDLKYHKLLKETFAVPVLPAFRPDRAVNIEKPGFQSYLVELSLATDRDILSVADMQAALAERLDYFVANGSVASDHGMDKMVYEPGYKKLADVALQKAQDGRALTEAEVNGYKTAMLLFLANAYKKRNMVMEIHFGVVRNGNGEMFRNIGADAGFDSIRAESGADNLIPFLNACNETGSLPKTIIFSLNPNDNAVIQTASGSFQKPGTKGYVQQGAAWWFADAKCGIEEHLKSYAQHAPLDTFLGMLTDSRSLLSYARHDYFRRILANYLGTLIATGEYPEENINDLIETAKNIAYHNAKEYFFSKASV